MMTQEAFVDNVDQDHKIMIIILEHCKTLEIYLYLLKPLSSLVKQEAFIDSVDQDQTA